MVSEALTNIKSNINSKLIEENQYDQQKKYSFFEDPKDSRKQNFVAFMIYDFEQLDDVIISKLTGILQMLSFWK